MIHISLHPTTAKDVEATRHSCDGTTEWIELKVCGARIVIFRPHADKDLVNLAAALAQPLDVLTMDAQAAEHDAAEHDAAEAAAEAVREVTIRLFDGDESNGQPIMPPPPPRDQADATVPEEVPF